MTNSLSDTRPPAPAGGSHVTVDPKVLYVGTPVALVTTMSPDGTCNIGPMSSAWTLGRTVVLGWEATSQTLANLEREGECVINYPDAGRWEQVDAIATLTGHNPPAAHKADQFTYEPDKWTPGRFTPQPSSHVAPPRIAECPIQCEVEVVAIHQPQGPDGVGFRIVETHVRAVHADRRIVVPESNHIDTSAWEPLLYVFRDYFGTGELLGHTRRR
jgi:flavin reductase (DIM6/NTAB) family NADH-FMN oxidoreductase RutF